MSRRALAALCLFSVLAPSRARAEAPTQTAPADPICDREASAITRSACVIGRALAGQAPSALVNVSAAPSAERLALPAALSERLAQLVAAKLGPAALPSARALTLSEARARASSARGLVHVTAALYRDRLEVAVDVYMGAGRFWQRLRYPGLRLTGHVFTQGPLDPELRALFPAIPLVVTRIDKALHAERDTLALACGDVRGDGSHELVTVGRRKIEVGRLEHGRFASRASLDWSEASAIAQSPLRQPIATCSLRAPGRLWVGLSDRADALELSGTLHVQGRFHGVMPWPGGGCTRRSGLGYDGRAQSCPNSSAFVGADFAASLDAFAARSLLARDGQAHTLHVGRVVGSDAARALDSLHPEVTVPSVGAQLSIADLDEDGLPEIVSSSATLDRHADELVIRTLSENGQLRERFRLKVPTGIDALTVCPGDGRAMAPLALATGNEIWIVR